MTISELLDQEKRISAYIEEFIESLVNKIESTPVDGVKPISKSPNCYVVKLSTIKNNNLMISPEYYSPVSQARYVRHALEYCKTATAMMEKIDQIAYDRFVRINGVRYFLNDHTVNILKEATL